ncbi:hypothetical protein ES703_83083 [subsurface metagenome]
MLDVSLYRRFCKRKISWHEFKFPGPGHLDGKHLQKTQQGLQVDLLPQDDPFCLVKIGQVCGIHPVVAEAANNPKVLSRHFGPGQGPGRKNSALAAQDHAPGKHTVEGIAPAQTPGFPAALMGCSHLVQIGLLNLPGMGWILDMIYVVDIPGRVKLRHKQRIAVPKLCLQQGPVKLFKAQGDQFILQLLQEFHIRIFSAQQHAQRRNIDVVAPQGKLFPLFIFKQFGR